MRRLISRLPAFGAVLLILPFAQAEDNPAGQELRELRRVVEQQSKQIELLAEQVGRLTRALETTRTSRTGMPVPRADFDIPTSESAPEAPRAEPVPKAEPTVGGSKHVVAKGETLTSIAKQYNIPIAELKNANKIENERLLQIGQILTVPTAKAPDPADKKENP